MQILYYVVKFLPYWAIPLMILAAEQAFVFGRRGRKSIMVRWLVVGFFALVLTLSWFILGLDQVAYNWIHG